MVDAIKMLFGMVRGMVLVSSVLDDRSDPPLERWAILGDMCRPIIKCRESVASALQKWLNQLRLGLQVSIILGIDYSTLIIDFNRLIESVCK